jgi:hypothetical protein
MSSRAIRSKMLNQSRVNLLLHDADLALTSTEVARTTSDQDSYKHAVRNAKRAYKVIRESRLRFDLSTVQAEALDQKLEQIKRCLEQMDEIVCLHGLLNRI